MPINHGCVSHSFIVTSQIVILAGRTDASTAWETECNAD
jgi:hypothetical protein